MPEPRFKPCMQDQPMLLPPDIGDLVPEGSMPRVVDMVVRSIDRIDADGPLSRRRRARPRPADDAQGGAARLRLRDLLQPRDRAGHPRERRVPVDMRHAAARPLHGQPLPHRAGAARLRGGVLRGHPAPRGHGPGDARHLLPGRHQGRGQREQVHVRVGEVDRAPQGPSEDIGNTN